MVECTKGCHSQKAWQRRFTKIVRRNEQAEGGEMIKLNGREVIEIEIDGIDHNDAPDYADAFISGAVWADSGHPLDENDIYKLQDEEPELIYDLIGDY